MFILWMCQMFPQPFPKTSHSPDQTMCDMQEETRDKINQFIALGCRVYEMGECQSSGQTFCKQSSHYHSTRSL